MQGPCSRQCFEGEAPIILEISSADTGLNPDKVGICLGSITGGMMPSSNDMLHIFAIVSAKSGSSCLMSHVGAGSSRQCFEGEAPIILEISSADTGLNPDRVGICLGSITGGMSTGARC